ncbi:TPA: DUF6378 domain-containing protein [Escherichia coli]|uniref:DUF6378 domain-containing protein n=1 Tax=Escherichia coli TaxID=562 RepID=UPI0020328E31|nr:DUF6378 domain-containing protein [Escherichia coli]
MSKAAELLRLAAETIEARGEQNGYDRKEEKSAPKVAAIFNAKMNANLTPLDVWDLLICLKEARLGAILSNGSDPLDTLIDLIAYNALKAEQILTEREEEQKKKQGDFDMSLNCRCKKTSIPGDLIASGEVIMNGSFQLGNGWRFNKEALLYTPKDHKNGKGDD